MAKDNRKSLKKLYNWHAWVGFNFAILMFVVLFTGTIATVSNEIDWFIFDELRASSKPEGRSSKPTADDWIEIYASIKNAYPNGQPRFMLTLGEDYLTFRAMIDDEAIDNEFVQVDQWTYEVTGTMPRLSVQRFFRDFHRYLFMPALPGIIFSCSMAFILAISIYTGLKTTRNWRKALFRVRFDKGGRIALSDLHKFMGLWGVWFTILMCVTGLWYFYEFGYRFSGDSVEPRGPQVELAEQSNSPLSTNNNQSANEIHLTAEEFTKAIRTAQNVHDDWHITSIIIPQNKTSPIQMRGVKNNPLLRDRAYRVFIHPDTLRVISIFTPESIGVNAYLNEYADPLHFGTFGGIWTKVIWLIFGVALTGMSLTGVWMTWKRIKSKSLTRTQLGTLPIFVLAAIALYFYIGRFT